MIKDVSLLQMSREGERRDIPGKGCERDEHQIHESNEFKQNDCYIVSARYLETHA